MNRRDADERVARAVAKYQQAEYSRRELLKRLGVGVVTIGAVPSMLAACGGGGGEDGPDGPGGPSGPQGWTQPPAPPAEPADGATVHGVFRDALVEGLDYSDGGAFTD